MTLCSPHLDQKQRPQAHEAQGHPASKPGVGYGLPGSGVPGTKLLARPESQVQADKPPRAAPSLLLSQPVPREGG